MSINPQNFIPGFFFLYVPFPKSSREPSLSVSKESSLEATCYGFHLYRCKALRDHIFKALPFAD